MSKQYSAAPPLTIDSNKKYSATIETTRGTVIASKGNKEARVSTIEHAMAALYAAGIDVYRPYLTSAEAFGGLQEIHSPAPAELSPINWLNIFYAIEWVAFMLFAFYLWYRLVKDAVEREVEAIEDAQAAAEAGPGPGAVAGPADGDRPRR